MSVFEAEMRRRIWATAVEFELQASIERGMASISHGYVFDTRAPLNVEDECIDEESEIGEPISQSRDRFTPASFQHLAHDSLKLRIELNAYLNDPRTAISYSNVLNYEREINQALSSLPTLTDPRALLSTTLLRLQLLIYIIMLHTPFVSTTHNPSHTHYSFLTISRTASEIITLYTTLSASNIHTLSLMRNDVFRAALSLAHSVLVFPSPKTSFESSAFMEPFLPPIIESIAQAVTILGDAVTRLGSGARELWVISAANALVKAKSEPAREEEYKKTALDDLMWCLQDIIDNQVEGLGDGGTQQEQEERSVEGSGGAGAGGGAVGTQWDMPLSTEFVTMGGGDFGFQFDEFWGFQGEMGGLDF